MLEELKANGVDLTRPVRVLHYLYCDKRHEAERIRKAVSDEGFSSEVRRAALGDNWLVLARRTQVVSDSAISELRAILEKLAGTVSGGEYDGWEVEISAKGQASNP